MKRLNLILVVTGLILGAVDAQAQRDGGAQQALGYAYLSPLPGSQYCSAQTCFVLVRFAWLPPAAVTNLAQCIQVTGASSGLHPGTTRIASDNQTVIFETPSGFNQNELVTVTLTPRVDLTTNTAIPPYQYQFMISGAMTNTGAITARGDNPPNAAMAMAFDDNLSTEWQDLTVPNGSTNFSWIQYVYPGGGMHVVNCYALTSANDNPAGDPGSWQLYGVTTATNLILLDTQTNQIFSNRLQSRAYTFTNTTAYCGYRLLVTRVNNPATATSVQLAELELIPATGSLLWECWLGLAGSAVTNLTGSPAYPGSPSLSDQLPSFNGPVNWAQNYGARVRGFITAPNTGTYQFWISSDDNSELWFSTNANPANASLIASVPGWTSPQVWNTYASQQSVPINLQSGQIYYIEARHKQGPGGDNLAVGWSMPGQASSAPSEIIPGEVLSPWPGGSSGTPLDIALNSSAAITSQTRASRSQVLSVATGSALVTTHAQQPSSTKSALNKTSGLSLITPLTAPSGTVPGQDGIMPNGVSVPTDFPYLNITTSNNPDPEYIFIDNRGGNGDPWNVIFDNSGQPVWYSKYPDERRDMKVQHNGVMTMLARDQGGDHFNGFNTNYQQIVQYWTTNGYSGDEHELQVLADGTYFMTALLTETVDMSRYLAGGVTNASVTESVIQGFTAAGDLIFQWRAWDHINILDEQQFIALTSSSFDFPHMNSIDADTDGNILLSSRNTSECTKINRNTGHIIWRLGGVRSSFTFPNDPLDGPRNQHALRMVSTNDYTLFDDGNLHNPSVSRGVEYLVNTNNLTATVVWQYPPVTTTALYSYYMGNAQRLTNGNTLIDWAVGPLPKLTEVRPDGTKAFEMNWVNQYEAYRTWRCTWHGVALQPYLLLESYPDNVTLLFNQFGDTNVAYYRIYGGPTSQSTNFLANSTTTLARLAYLQNNTTYYFRVVAVHRDGTLGQFSNEQSATVNLVQPGQNMVSNGNFSAGTNGWILSLANSGSAVWAVTNGVGYFTIANGGTYATDIQLQQTGFRLIQGFQYILAFDAWATRPRYIQAEVGEAASPYLNYSGLAATALTPIRTHFQYAFTMAQPSDFSANVMFNLGTSTAGVSLANASLSIAPPTTATALTWAQSPAGSVAGSPISPEIQVAAYNETYPVAGLPISLSLTSGIGVLSGIQTTNTDTNGIAHFPNLSVSQAGLKQITASYSSLVITSAVFNLTTPPVTATALSWVQQPSSALAGTGISPEIQVAAWTNSIPVTNMLLTLSLNYGTGSLTGIQATNTDSNGIAHFPNLSINLVGLKQLAVGDATATLVTNSTSFTIGAATANKLVIAQPPPANATAGVVMTPGPVVQVTDLYGNVISNASDIISAVQTSGTGGNLNATTAAQMVTASSGTAVFSGLYVTNATGIVTLTFTDPGLPNPLVTSSVINVSPSVATRLKVTQQPSSTASAGVPFAQQPGVAIADVYGNTVSSYTTAVMATETVGGNLNATTAASLAMPANGVATFTGLFVTNAGPSVILNFTSGGLTPVNAAAINVSAGPASLLTWTTQPGNAIAGLPFGTQPVLQTADAYGNPSASGLPATQNVQVLLSAGTGPLLGTTNYNLGFAGGNGVVSFTDLSLNVPGTGCVLTATNTTPVVLTPPQQNQLGLWLDASVLNSLTLSQGYVTEWNDLSGHGRNASGGNSPVFATNSILATGQSGLGRVVRFNGSTTYLIVDLTFLNQTPYTIAVLEVATNKGSLNNYFMGDTGNGGNTTDNALHTGYRNSGDFTFAHYGDDLDVNPGSFTYPAARVWMDVIDGAKNKTIYLNGVPVATGIAAGFLNTSGSQGHIGSGFDTSSTCFQGDIAEILVYTNALNTSAASIANYLNIKWLCANCAMPALASAMSVPFTVNATPPPSQKILGATVAGNDSVILTYATTAGFQYHVQFTTNLALGSWINLPASVTNTTGAVAIFTDTNSLGGNQRFYRVVSP
jgi:hypothetical protein